MKTMLSRHFRSSIYIHKLFGGFWNLQSLLGLTSSQNRAVSSIHTSQSARFNLFHIFFIFNFDQFLCMTSRDKTPMTKIPLPKTVIQKISQKPQHPTLKHWIHWYFIHLTLFSTEFRWSLYILLNSVTHVSLLLTVINKPENNLSIDNSVLKWEDIL